MDELKLGTLVGTDKYGNKYYQNKRFFYGRNRWVEYAPQYCKSDRVYFVFTGLIYCDL